MVLPRSLNIVGVDLEFFQFNKVFFVKFEQVAYKGMGNNGGMWTGITNPNPNHYCYERNLGETHQSHQTLIL